MQTAIMTLTLLGLYTTTAEGFGFCAREVIRSVFDSEIAHRVKVNEETGMTVGYIEPRNVDKTKDLIVMVHGFPETPFHFEHYIKELKQDYYPVAIYLRGYGLSKSFYPLTPDDISIEELAGDVKFLIEALGKEQAFVFAHDFGTIPAFGMAALHPEMVKGVMLFSVPLGPLPFTSPESIQADFQGLRNQSLQYYADYWATEDHVHEFNSNPRGWLSSLYHNFYLVKPLNGPYYSEDVMRNASQYVPVEFNERDFNREVCVMKWTGMDVAASLYYGKYIELFAEMQDIYLAGKSVQGPYALIMGSDDPLVNTFSEALKYLDTLPGYRFHHLLDGAGHTVLLTEKTAVLGYMKDFLNSVN